jgi:protein involved in polysaccharide export with SLBB domain
VVAVNPVDRDITLAGAVRRPGTYRLLENENLRDLIMAYGDGLLPIADISRMELLRYVESEHESGDKLFLTGADLEKDFPLRHLDSITIPNITDLNPVMFVEGAVQNNDAEEGGMALATSNRLIIRFYYGENYASLVQRNRGWFTAISDTRNAYIIRGGERTPMNLNPMLYDSGYRSEYYVEHEDVLIVPFRQYFVTVAGAVGTPGRYPYIPDRDWEYYIAMAGGFDRAKNAKERVVIRDLAGKRMGKEDKITPETIITASTNSFLHNFNQVAPVVTTVLSIATTLISVFLLVNR